LYLSSVVKNKGTVTLASVLNPCRAHAEPVPSHAKPCQKHAKNMPAQQLFRSFRFLHIEKVYGSL
jgi:hypothetical protein